MPEMDLLTVNTLKSVIPVTPLPNPHKRLPGYHLQMKLRQPYHAGKTRSWIKGVSQYSQRERATSDTESNTYATLSEGTCHCGGGGWTGRSGAVCEMIDGSSMHPLYLLR
jgi:hypothetical protein